MKHLTITTCLIAAIALLPIGGCSHKHFTPDAISDANPWTHLKMNNDPENFRFVIVADRTGGNRPGIFADAIKKINHLQPEFVISIGDLVEGNKEKTDELVAQWDEFDTIVEKLEMPFFYVTGNHDLTGEKAIQIYKQRRGRIYYHFLYKDVLFLCTSSEDVPGSGGIGGEQIDYFADVLQKHKKTRWVCVLVHKPLWKKEEVTGWKKFSSLLAGRDHTVFAGHSHRYSKAIRDGTNYYQLATTGGTSNLTGPQDGRFDHIMSVTMTDQGPRIANLSLDGIFGDDPPAETAPAKVKPEQGR